MADAGSCEILPLTFESVGYSVRGESLLDQLSFEIRSGRPTVVLGSNGAGKSLTLRLAHGLIQPSRGRVRWLGEGAGSAASHQAMVFERAVLLRRSARANIEYALALRHQGRSERAERARRILERTGLLPLADRPARVLSSGEQRRLSIARAWVLEPQILFLDEPSGNLDPTATRQVEEIIEEMVGEGCKVVMTSHDLGQARRLAGDVLFLHRGRLLEKGSADHFFERPETDEGRSFLAGNLLW